MSQLFRDPQIPDGEQIRYQATVGKAEESYRVLSRIYHDGDKRYRSRLEAELGPLTMQVTQEFTRTDGLLACESYVSEASNGGRLVSREEGYFQGTSHLQFGGKVRPYPRDVIPLLGCLVGLRGLDFTRGAKREVNLWLAFSVFWPLEVKVERRETVRVPAGEIDAWRVRVRPSFAQISGLLDKVVGGLLPPFVLHFEAAHPHRMLRFVFPTGPLPWNPKGLVEATELG